MQRTASGGNVGRTLKKTHARPETCVRPSDGSLGVACCVDVAGDLRHELVLGVERALVPEATPELDDQTPAVEVAFEVEQVGLDAALVSTVMRVHADRDRGPVPER